LIVSAMAAPGLLISTSPPAALTAISSIDNEFG
jgi:hypothetical protein